MKEKLKKFIKDHKNDIIDVFVIGGGFGMALCATYVVANRVGYKAAKKDFNIMSANVYRSMSGDQEHTAIIVWLAGADPVVCTSKGDGLIESVKKAASEG